MRGHQVQEFISRYLSFIGTAGYSAWADILQHAQSLLSHISMSLDLEITEVRADHGLQVPFRMETMPSPEHIVTELLRRTLGERKAPPAAPMEGVVNTAREGVSTDSARNQAETRIPTGGPARGG